MAISTIHRELWNGCNHSIVTQLVQRGGNKTKVNATQARRLGKYNRGFNQAQYITWTIAESGYLQVYL